MSSYDPEKDKLIEELGPVGESGLFAEVRRYDGEEEEGVVKEGVPKLSIYKLVGKNSQRRQVVRLTFAEVLHLGEFFSDFSATHGTGEE
jgi:hypothetical protein